LKTKLKAFLVATAYSRDVGTHIKKKTHIKFKQMKTIFKLTLITLILTSCGESTFKDFSESKKKRIITENVKIYFDKNKTKIDRGHYLATY